MGFECQSAAPAAVQRNQPQDDEQPQVANSITSMAVDCAVNSCRAN